ncbi:CC0125/CC1285 family lipoprotein [Maridesulfovibrio sp.]|uniref:CC0125/CC1285 family lipoprotein n=1 Tax=Maridesulfovibrio sp. TaxID=2795000 RepID=UPI003BA8A048
MKLRFVYILALFLILAGCATPYQSDWINGGYTSTQLDQNVFVVSFKGNGFTKSDTAVDYTLLRCSELTLENGYKYFVIIDSSQDNKTSSYTTPKTYRTDFNSRTNINNYGYGTSAYTYGTATTMESGGQTFTTSKPRIKNTIVCFKNKPAGFAYNAELLNKSLKQKHNLN